MICPHCSTVVKFEWNCTDILQKDELESIGTQIRFATCPNCYNLVIYLDEGGLERDDFYHTLSIKYSRNEKLVFPKKSIFQDIDYIPKEFLEDYEEALKVLSASPKASAALTRRLLQNIIREKFGIKENSLSKEIEKFISLSGIPTHLTSAVDAVRNIGNFAAHAAKDKNTGEIVQVEAGEAEWLIQVIEALFDFTFIQPITLDKRKQQLNEKLKKIGKPPMK